MAINRPAKHLTLVQQSENELARLAAERPTFDLAQLAKQQRGGKLSRAVERSYERIQRKSEYLVNTTIARNATVQRIGQQTQADFNATLDSWDAFLAANADRLTEDERKALLVCREDQLAAIVGNHRSAIVQTNAQYDQEIADMFARRPDEWRKPTFTDGFNSAASMGEADLEEMGLPPLSTGESVANFFLLGLIADKRRRDYLRAQWRQWQAMEEGEEVIDAEFTQAE